MSEKQIEHPLEEVFDIEPGTTMVEYEEHVPTVLVEDEKYDDKDVEIEEQFQQVYDKAMDAFDAQQEITEQVEGKYAARNAEVAAVFLNTALHAAKEKSSQKQHKDKLEISKQNVGTPGTVNNNLIMDRNEAMKLLRETQEREIKDITNEDEVT